MKQDYGTPKAEKMEFDYSETITASGASGHAYQKYIDAAYGCQTTPTGEWYDMVNDSDGSCMVRIQ